jgi:hypothetical protein
MREQTTTKVVGWGKELNMAAYWRTFRSYNGSCADNFCCRRCRTGHASLCDQIFSRLLRACWEIPSMAAARL